MKRIIAFLTLLALSSPAFGQMTSIQKQELRSVNLIQNPGFENGKVKWSATAGTFAITNASSNLGIGTYSASYQATGASQILASAAQTVPAGLYGAQCIASIFHKGGDANLVLEVYDSTSSSTLGTLTLAANTNYATDQILFQCPAAADSLQLRIRSTAASAVMYFDQAFMGYASRDPATVVSPVVYSLTPSVLTAMGSAGFNPAGHTLAAADFATTKEAFWNSFGASNLSDAAGTNNCSSGTAACALTNPSTAVTFGSTGISGSATAASFNGTTAELDCTDSFCKPGSNSAAYYAWINPTTWNPAGAGIIFGQYDPSANRAMEFYLQGGGNLVLNVYQASQATACQIITPVSTLSGWHHVAAVIDSAGLKCYQYIDGKLAASMPMSAAMYASTATLKIGAEGVTSSAFFSGKMEQIGIVNGYTMTADDIHKLYARTLTHNANLLVQNQQWTAHYTRSDSKLFQPETLTNWIVDAEPNTVYADFTGVPTGASVDLELASLGMTGQTIPGRYYDSGYLSSTPGTTISHSLPDVPLFVRILYETATNQFVTLPEGDWCDVTSTQLLCDWTGLTVSGSNRVRIVAGGALSQSAIPPADANTTGTVTNGTQTIGGLKDFQTGAKIKGITDGSTATSGYVGEYIAATGCTTDTSQSSPTTSTWYDVTSCTLPLTAGEYIIGLWANVQMGTESLSASSYTFPMMRIRDSLNNLYGAGPALGQYSGRANSFNNMTQFVHVNITSSTTFKPSFGFSQLSAGSSVSYVEINASAGHINFYAQRIR